MGSRWMSRQLCPGPVSHPYPYWEAWEPQPRMERGQPPRPGTCWQPTAGEHPLPWEQHEASAAESRRPQAASPAPSSLPSRASFSPQALLEHLAQACPEGTAGTELGWGGLMPRCPVRIPRPSGPPGGCCVTQAGELSHLRPQEPTCNQGIMSESPQSLAEWLTGGGGGVGGRSGPLIWARG